MLNISEREYSQLSEVLKDYANRVLFWKFISYCLGLGYLAILINQLITI